VTRGSRPTALRSEPATSRASHGCYRCPRPTRDKPARRAPDNTAPPHSVGGVGKDEHRLPMRIGGITNAKYQGRQERRSASFDWVASRPQRGEFTPKRTPCPTQIARLRSTDGTEVAAPNQLHNGPATSRVEVRRSAIRLRRRSRSEEAGHPAEHQGLTGQMPCSPQACLLECPSARSGRAQQSFGPSRCTAPRPRIFTASGLGFELPGAGMQFAAWRGAAELVEV